MSEEVIYSDSIVTVSTSRIVISGTTYALRNITSVKMTFAPAKTGCAIALIIVGAIVLIGGFSQGSYGILPGIVIGAIIGGLGFLWLQSSKPDYFVTIASSSGEVRALTSKDKTYVEKIVGAINDAIVQYR
jgi:membrane-bound ClpP family serine protease